MLGVSWALGDGVDALGPVCAAVLGPGLWVGVSCGSMAWSRPGMACRSWLCWSSIACVDSSVAVVGGGSVECSLTGLVEEASLIGAAGWQILISGSGVGNGGGGV